MLTQRDTMRAVGRIGLYSSGSGKGTASGTRSTSSSRLVVKREHSLRRAEKGKH